MPLSAEGARVSSIPHVYRYAVASALRDTASGQRLELATSGGVVERTHFLEGRLVSPRRTADFLTGIAEIAGARFYRPDLWRTAMDPVVTSDGERLRFESFSQCCSVHARADLLPAAIESDASDAADGGGGARGRGTTNVDFNAPMRAALGRVRDDQRVVLKVGARDVTLESGSGSVVERKVALPLRWIQGFGEIPSYQSRLIPKLEIPAAEARRFLRSLPRGRSYSPDVSWIVPAAGGLRLSQRATAEGIPVNGLERLAVLEPLCARADMLRIREVPGAGVTSWEIVAADARFCLLLSPQSSRGFSGEGQALGALAGDGWRELLPRVRAALRWRGRILADDIAREIDRPAERVAGALSALAARGLVGFDAEEGAYFHRELPFDLEAVERKQPRLRNARALVAEDAAEIVRRDGRVVEAFVRSGETEYHVRLLDDGDTCNCPWFGKHAGKRGPCKHVLAARLALQGAPEDGP